MIKIIILISFIFYWTESNACQCLPMSIKQNFSQSSLVFSGEVIAVSTLQQFDNMLPKGNFRQLLLATIKVTKFYKGKTSYDTIDVITGDGLADCGYDFVPKKKYIVYAAERDYSIIDSTILPSMEVIVSTKKYFYTSNCDRTTYEVIKEQKVLKKFLRRLSHK